MYRHPRLEAVLLASVVATGARAVSAQPCEPYWSDEFPSADLDWAVVAITDFDDGSGDGAALYIGGWFTTGDDVPLNRIARLHGNGWAPLGSGMDGSVLALSGFDDGSDGGPALYAGGWFTTAGGVRVNNIARWDGASWSPLGGGVSGDPLYPSVHALAVFDDGSCGGPALYAGGWFTTAGGVRVNNIAKWDGNSWSTLAAGMDSTVTALAVFDDGSGGGPALYAGGYFTAAGGISANNIAKWDGSTWSPLGGGMDGTVNALTVFDDGTGGRPALYAGGSFRTAGDLTVNRIAKWDGSTWSPLGSGTDGSVQALAVFDDGSGDGAALCAAGFFTTAGDLTVNRIAKWDGSSWSPLGGGMDSAVVALAAFDDRSGGGSALYAGGSFHYAGGVQAENVAKWDGSAWLCMGSGASGETYALAVFEDGAGAGPALYVGGEFTCAAGIQAQSIVKWDGQVWSSLGSGLDDRVTALAVFDDGAGSGPALYAAGKFTTAGGVAANRIAKWDGKSWSALATGLKGWVFALAVFDDGSGPALYAGGALTSAGGVEVNNIAKWDGSSWSPLGSGTDDYVWALAVFDDGSGSGPALYAGGWFEAAGGVDADYIARWDGTRWSPLATGMNGPVYSLMTFDDGAGGGQALYAGGSFTEAGGGSASNIATWDGSTWSPLGNGILGRWVLTLGTFTDGLGRRPSLYAGGWFFEAGGVSAVSIAKWDGTAWFPLGQGMEGGFYPYAWDLAVFDDGSGTGPALFVGGEFNIAGGVSSQRIAKWVGCAGVVLGDLDGDGTVGIFDLLILLGSWGPCADCDVCPADLDGDCTVGILDLLTLLTNWG